MKMKRSYQEFLQDILDAITEIESFIDGISFDDFQSDRTKVLAVVKLLEIVGEAVKKFLMSNSDFIQKYLGDQSVA